MKMPFPSRRSVWKAARSALLLLCMAAADRGIGNAAPVPAQGSPVPSAEATSHFAIADFDGDNQPDLATVQPGESGGSETRYWIRLQLSTGSRRAIGVSAPAGGLEIASRDVNGDKLLDLVVTTAWLNQPVVVLLNDGHGNFTLSNPAEFPGAVWDNGTSGVLASVPLRDAAVAALWPGFCGDFDGSKSIPSARQLPGMLVSLNSHVPAFSLCASVLGRAPPIFAPYV
jgi:hypothetical protein